MRTRVAILSAIFLLAGTTGLRETRATAQEGVPSPCVVTVPSKWGVFKGLSTYGLAFEDDAGTIRLIDQMPCSIDRGVATQPNILVEVHRK